MPVFVMIVFDVRNNQQNFPSLVSIIDQSQPRSQIGIEWQTS